jgi:hypothetical protein
MSFALWQKLPEGFLKKGFSGWSQLDYGVKQLVVELARYQKFKCALCNNNKVLVIEHDHEPEEGRGNRPTIYNIRGLVCTACNNDLSVYEREERREYSGLENVTSRLSSREYEDYIDVYKCRISPLLEVAHERRVGCANVWHRRLILQKFDDWYYEGGQPPSWWRRYKENENREIRTPEQFLRTLIACMQFVVEELKKDPNFQPPENFLKIMVRIQPIIEQANAIRN